MVKLRPSSDDWPRERTPALRPSPRNSKAAVYDDQEVKSATLFILWLCGFIK